IDYHCIVCSAVYKEFGAASELADGNALALLAGPLQENLRDSGHLTGELRRGPLSNMVGSAQPIVLLGTEGRRKSYVEPRVTATFRLSQANHSRTNFVGQCRRNETARVASQS